MIYLLDLFGVAVFAVSGSLSAGRKRMDIFGVVVVALTTALGGGTLRDVILGTYPVYWITDQTYIFVATGASLLTFMFASHLTPGMVLKTADAAGLAVFTVIGAQKALSVGTLPVVGVIMGMMTGVAGGMVRDILTGEIPLILRKEIYATASLCGAAVFAVLSGSAMPEKISIFAGAAVTLSMRLAALHWKLSLPVFPGKGQG